MANLANPTVSVDDNVIEIKPNSLTYKTGSGDLTVRTQQAGEAVTTVANVDSETKLSMVKFTLINTTINHKLVQQWLDLREGGGVTIDVFDGSIQMGFISMVIPTEPERSTGAEGEIEVEFTGPPASA